MDEIVVVSHGLLPSEEYTVLARGSESMKRAQELDILSEGPVHWDGRINYMAVGGKYAVISEEATEEQLKEVQEKHTVEEEELSDEFGSSAITDDEEVVQMNICDVQELF